MYITWAPRKICFTLASYILDPKLIHSYQFDENLEIFAERY